MHIYRWLSPFIFGLVFIGCNSAPALDNFNPELWESDKYGCSGERGGMYASLKSQKQKLLGLNEMEIVSVLGNPDENELFTRNQKFYYYYLEPSAKCKNPSPSAKRLVLRFNAVGLVKEVNEE